MKKFYSLTRVFSKFLPVAGGLFPFLASAAKLTPQTPITSVEGVESLLICSILNWLYTFVIIFSVIMIILAAYQYLTSQGNQEKVDGATKSITYAIVGIAVAILAKGVPFLIANFLSDGLGGPIC